jgi:hypothetical protein
MPITSDELGDIAFKSHADEKWGYQFFYPEGWHRFTFADDREGVLYSPQPDAWATSFGVEVKGLAVEVTKEDLPDLEEGFRQGIAALPECQVTWFVHQQVEPTIIVEAKYTFREDDATRQRRARLVYSGARQFHVFAQGATAEEYEHWRLVLNLMMMSFSTTAIPPAAERNG